MTERRKTVTEFFVDVEATGGPTPYSGVMTEFGAVERRSRATFHGRLWPRQLDPAQLARAMALDGGSADALQVFTEFAAWLESFGSRPVLVSDNPAFDAMWIADGFDRTLGRNPFGHSARRIGDFAAGLAHDWRRQSNWKRLRRTKHDHHPVHDALGNLEAFEALIAATPEASDADVGGTSSV